MWSESDDDDDLHAIGAEDEMVTQSSSHVNEGHGRRKMCPYTELDRFMPFSKVS